jgi:RimJ/RimL family protein N-acetyltransferase
MISRILPKKWVTKKGTKVTARFLEWNDLEGVMKFANDLSGEDTFVQLNGEDLTREDEVKYLSKALSGMELKKEIHMVVEADGNIVGNSCITVGVRRKQHIGEIAISVSKDYRDEGIGYEMMQILILLARELKLKLLTLNCFENNPRALHIYEKCGFKMVGILPGALAYRGGYEGEATLYLPLG